MHKKEYRKIHSAIYINSTIPLQIMDVSLDGQKEKAQDNVEELLQLLKKIQENINDK